MRDGELCPLCMTGILREGRCSSCGKRPTEENRPPDALPMGCTLKDYWIGRVLGHGGFGITYLAWDRRNSCRVALKEFVPSGAVTRDRTSGYFRTTAETENYFRHVRQRFREEAQTIYALRRYPEIINVFDLFDAFGTSYYVMEYLDGEDFNKIVKREGKLKWQQLQRPIYDTLQALRILHNNGLIHRDISPDNIFWQRDGRTKLIDFGSVRRARADHFTRILKQEFAPLEQFMSDGQQGPWTDTFSLCASLYYMLSGGKAPASATVRIFEVNEGHEDSLVPIQEFLPEAPGYVCTAVMKGLSLEIDHRLKNADEMQNALFPRMNHRAPEKQIVLVCVRGMNTGRQILLHIGKELNIGRMSEGNDIPYPAETHGISRRQCAFYTDEGGNVYVKDRNSSYGTYLDGNRMKPEEWYRFIPGQTITFGMESYQILNREGR